MRWRSLAVAASALAASAASAAPGAAVSAAAEPILPLAEVQPGMQCTGLTVVRGVDIASFDVRIVDIVAGDRAADQPLLLVRVSGDVVAPTGIAEGYSGSPVVCDGRIAGAIAYGSGDYGNELGFATPIESMLGERVFAPAGARRAPALLRTARPLTPPLQVTGISPRVFSAFAEPLREAGIVMQVSPAAPIGARFPAQTLRPGSSMAVGLSSGDVALGGVGTVSYVDGDKVWGFGHPFEAAGRRSLLLQDAY
ncbi:MAG TPA: SpoIVB peptidase S55 domain-containing protein, partial [Capillimicrobium sp.]